MLVYRCDTAKNYLDQEGVCGTRDNNIKRCWGVSAIGAWAVGGKVFYFYSGESRCTEPFFLRRYIFQMMLAFPSVERTAFNT